MAREEREPAERRPETALSDEEIDDGEEAVENDENYDYLQATRPLDEEEMEAEAEGERLIDEDAADGFVFGMKDDERERAAFRAAGLDADAPDLSLIDDEEMDLDEREEARARRAAERHLRARDRLQRRSDKRDIWERLMEEDEDEAAEMERLLARVQQRRRNLQGVGMGGEDLNLRDLQQAKSLLAESNPRLVAFGSEHQQALDTLFRYFLYHFSLSSFKKQANVFVDGDEGAAEEAGEEGAAYYLDQINKLILADKTTLVVDVRHLLFVSEQLVQWLELHPTPALQVLSDAVTAEAAAACPSLYGTRICQCSLTNWPYKQQLRALRCSDLNTLVCVSLSEAPLQVVEGQRRVHLPKRCPNCQGGRFVLDRLRTTYSDVQRLTLQESPAQCPPGRPPRQREVLLSGELVDSARPGETVEVLGVYRTKYDVALNVRNGFPVLGTEIWANAITTRKHEMIRELTDEDVAEIQALSRQPNIRERIIASIAPTLCASKQVKTAVAYALFGGVPKGRNTSGSKDVGGAQGKHDLSSAATVLADGSRATGGQHVIRGDINVLLLGDPGLGKSQALQYVAQTFPRSVSTTGKGASSVGLTAGVRRDPYTGEWTLEGGALVLADEGICLIDEFDKMSDRDRVSIHEAMEQQSISISKAGIVTSLRARCSVIAAANPKFGRYIPSYTFKENVDLSDPILSRFDLICVLRDIPDADDDFSLGDYVLTNHQLHHPGLGNLEEPQKRARELEARLQAGEPHEPINQDLLQKYILYARTRCHPVLDPSLPALASKLSSFYARLRQRAAATGGLPLTLRDVEALLRISEANAKMRLSPVVTSLDVDFAIAAVLDSFLSAQKFAVQQRLSKEFARYRALATGGWSALSALLRRLLQQRLQRLTLRQQTSQSGNAGEVGGEESLLRHQEIEAARRVEYEEFLKVATQHKFTAYQVDNWISSNSFKANFSVVEENGSRVLQSNHWKSTSSSQATTVA